MWNHLYPPVYSYMHFQNPKKCEIIFIGKTWVFHIFMYVYPRLTAKASPTVVQILSAVRPSGDISPNNPGVRRPRYGKQFGVIIENHMHVYM